MSGMSTTLWAGLILTVLVVSVVGWYFFSSPKTVKNFPSTHTGPVMLFGDSLAEGVGASPGRDLGSLLQAKLGTRVDNYGVAGDTTADGLRQLPAALNVEPRLVIVILGGNDFLKKIPRNETFANLEAIITAFQREGAMVMLIGVRSGIIGGGADEEFEELAERAEAAYVEDILSGVFGDRSLMSDAIHPNDRGYAKIADRLMPEIQKLLEP